MKGWILVRLEKNYRKYILISFCVFAVCIVLYVLFKYPQPGVADQGDFDRVMFVSGLQLTDQNKSDPNFKRFYDYTVTDYKIKNYSISGFAITLFSTSMGYLITFIGFICKILGQNIFKTGYLAAAYAVLYIFAIAVIIKYMNLKSKAVMAVFSLLSLFVLLDGSYLLWFNSLYGEPMMSVTLLLYISSWLYYLYYKNVLKSDAKLFRRIIFIFVAAFFLIGSKMQVISALPAILAMHGWLLWENRHNISRRQLVAAGIFLCILILYPLQISKMNGPISKDTQYNSVFYGVLKDSKNPRQDLADMGLNPDMAVEAGKHAYLAEKEYVKYIPRTEITEKEFYSKMTNGKLIKFYITHPGRLIQGMEYTAGHAFYTSTSLGKYQREYSEKPVREFNRFTYWSQFRETLMPKKLIFIGGLYFVIFLISLLTYIKNKGNKEIRDKIYLLWMIMFVGLIQFPMPYMGNGQADTAKQLYLFNYVFDILLVISFCWCFDKLTKLMCSKVKK